MYTKFAFKQQQQQQKRLEPIWTVAKGALFILTVDSLELFEKGGLTFILEDWDKFKSNDLLGLTTVSPAALYRANGERMVFKLSTTGYLAIRCRRATDSDKKFIKEYEKSRRAVAVASEEQPKTTNNAIQSIVSRKTKTEGGVKKVYIYISIFILSVGSIETELTSSHSICHVVQSSSLSRSIASGGDRVDDK